MFARATVTVDQSVLDFIAQSAAKAPKRLQEQMRTRLSATKPRLIAKVSIYPPERDASDHVRWKSKRQQRAFYATQGFGRGIPTFRTGATANLWDISLTQTDTGGIVTLSNSSSYAPYVVGDDQQPFHYDQGWQTIDVLAESIADDVEAEVINTWFAVTDPDAGVR